MKYPTSEPAAADVEVEPVRHEQPGQEFDEPVSSADMTVEPPTPEFDLPPTEITGGKEVVGEIGGKDISGGQNEVGGKTEPYIELAPKRAKEEREPDPELPPTAEPPFGGRIAPKRAKTRKARERKVLDFDALKRAKESQATGKPHLPPRGQVDENWLKMLLPPPKENAWWEVPADDRGFRIKLRWRAGGKKLVYTFRRLGKNELKTLLEKSYDEQCRIVQDRLVGELREERRPDVASRFQFTVRDNQVYGGKAG